MTNTNGNGKIDLTRGSLPIIVVAALAGLIFAAGGVWTSRGQRLEAIEEWKMDAEVRLSILESEKRAREILNQRGEKDERNKPGTELQEETVLRSFARMGHNIRKRVRSFDSGSSGGLQRCSGRCHPSTRNRMATRGKDFVAP